MRIERIKSRNSKRFYLGPFDFGSLCWGRIFSLGPSRPDSIGIGSGLVL
jgi:hypothetical protein